MFQISGGSLRHGNAVFRHLLVKWAFTSEYFKAEYTPLEMFCDFALIEHKLLRIKPVKIYMQWNIRIGTRIRPSSNIGIWLAYKKNQTVIQREIQAHTYTYDGQRLDPDSSTPDRTRNRSIPRVINAPAGIEQSSSHAYSHARPFFRIREDRKNAHRRLLRREPSKTLNKSHSTESINQVFVAQLPRHQGRLRLSPPLSSRLGLAA